ncbi:hypothetical protein LS684_11680 [Cytobacillus spongiae]|jgi:hypothetical protein|nr:hypothetical protein [Cytobacillus spongiae]UII57921.1 hypothetical protein LS684_11680 [Cytobacillus spongiae]
MAVLVLQTFEIKQDKFKEAIDTLKKIQKYRTEKHHQKVEILTPITGNDHCFRLLTTYEGLAEMELQDKKMFNEEEYCTLMHDFFIDQIVQGSMKTNILRTMPQ